MKRLLRTLPLLALLLAFGTPLQAAPKPLEHWLATDALTLPHVLLDSVENYDPIGELFDADPVAPLDFWPEKGSEVTLAHGVSSAFAAHNLAFDPPEAGSGQLRAAYGATYLVSPLWQKGSLTVTGKAPFKLYYDGEELTSRGSAADSDTAEVSEDIILDQGTHRLLLLTAACSKDSLTNWGLTVSYEAADSADAAFAPITVLSPNHPFDITDYAWQESVDDLAISPDGRYVAVRIGIRDRDTLKKQSHLTVWDLKTKEQVWAYGKSVSPRTVLWTPDSRQLLLGLGGDDGTDFYLLSTDGWLLTEAARGVKDVGGIRIAWDSKGFYYTRSIKPEGEEKDYKVMWGLEDRWPGWRDQVEFRYFDFAGRTSTPVARGKYGPDAFGVTHDGTRIITYRSVPAVGRPFSKLEFWSLPLTGGKAKLITTLRMNRNSGFAISPDDSKLAFTGPYEQTLADSDPEKAHNPSNGYLWILDLKTGEAQNVSRDFEAHVDGSAYGTGANCDFTWGDDGNVYFAAFSFKKMLFCSYDPEKGTIDSHQLDTPGFSNLAMPTDKGARMVAYRGDKLGEYSDIYWHDLKRNRGGKLIELNTMLRRIAHPPVRVVDYDFVNSDGITIPGYLYYPADYDSTKSYPMIVDTYGGVIGFGDGWMWGNSFFADRGYFDYVPVPRGASGYGQAFSDGHEGEWGVHTSQDMNEGVRHVIAHVPGVDSTRVGFDSGSYGGFLAMYLLSMDKDDPYYFPYATAVGGYGISDIANYWGIGWWGFWYMEVSAPGKYPWATPQWFVDHSPVYHADNITKPLLLVHGDADTNVPPGNSDEMYTALKQLNRQVTFVRWAGEGHGTANDLLHYMQRKRIELEWFDKWLRDRPNAWKERMKDEMKK